MESDNNIPQALTFDDILLVPAYTDFLPKDATLNTQLTSSFLLNIPIISAAMDTVTSASMAIALAHEGGLGIIHKNLTVSQQVKEVIKVKTFESGVINNPIFVSSKNTVAEVLKIVNKRKISGFPVIDGNHLVGIVTRRDMRYVANSSLLVSDVMTPKERLVVVEENKSSAKQQRELLHLHRIERLLVVNNKKDFQLTGMITVKDINQSERFPFSCRDNNGSLRVGAAVGVASDRISPLIEAGVDVLVVDTAHGHSKAVINQVKHIKSIHSDVQVIAGNIATGAAALALAEAGADAVKVGIGPGSICTTRIVAGIGYPQVSAIQEVYKSLKGIDRQVGIIADGGIRYSGDISKAIASGADAVMLGSIFAGTEEAPGEVEYYQGRPYKVYRGMGSMGAMSEIQGSADRYFQESSSKQKLVPEGIEGRVPYKGSVHAVIHQLVGGIKASMGYTGCKTISALQKESKMIQITQAGMTESHVHDVSITKEAPNYRIN